MWQTCSPILVQNFGWAKQKVHRIGPEARKKVYTSRSYKPPCQSPVGGLPTCMQCSDGHRYFPSPPDSSLAFISVSDVSHATNLVHTDPSHSHTRRTFLSLTPGCSLPSQLWYLLNDTTHLRVSSSSRAIPPPVTITSTAGSINTNGPSC